MDQTSRLREVPYGAYHKRQIPPEDAELTHTNPGTPMGEYMRRFWQPVCLSQELTKLPKAVRILGENLVAFRDRSGRVGVLQRHCSHRGASLEYGIIGERGIRCCYHGWLYDIDGTLLEAPAEPADSRLFKTVCQGAYPAFERDGLVFAYMGPPEDKPEFPIYDSYVLPKGTRLIPFSNIYPCNWLQVYENIMDHMHTALLHNNMTVEGVDASVAEGLSLTGFGDMPAMRWTPTRNGNGMVFIANRRVGEHKVWVRITEMAFPNYLQIGSLVPSAASGRHSTTALTRWHVPVDDTHMIIFGWRHFNDEVDPDHVGCEADCGVDKIDFLDGQTGGRPYEEAQAAPGDWEALVSQRPIAIHALERPGTSDVGVYMCRKLLRRAVRGQTPADTSRPAGDTLFMYAQDSVLSVSVPMGDNDALVHVGDQVLGVLMSADPLPSDQRDGHVRAGLDAIDGGPSASMPVRAMKEAATHTLVAGE